MPVSVVVGGQFGSEGKGKIALFLAKELRADIAVRVGGSNSGHTVYDCQGVRHVFRHLPTAALLPNTVSLLGPGSYIDPEILQSEIESVGATPDRVIIDPNAFVITPAHKEHEARCRLGERIGSTLSGTGEAVVDRVRRQSRDNLASEHPYLQLFTTRGPVRTFLRDRLSQNARIVIEGTQGFGLSNLQSCHYPWVTSRDTTAAAFVAEAGVSPLDVDEVVLVIRAFPIRVAGDSGPLPKETDWQTIAREGGWTKLEERTTVTDRVRRVARFDPRVVNAAIEANRPTKLVINHVDYFDATTLDGELTSRTIQGLIEIEQMLDREADWIGISPSNLIFRDSRISSPITTQRSHELLERANAEQAVAAKQKGGEDAEREIQHAGMFEDGSPSERTRRFAI